MLTDYFYMYMLHDVKIGRLRVSLDQDFLVFQNCILEIQVPVNILDKSKRKLYRKKIKILLLILDFTTRRRQKMRYCAR